MPLAENLGKKALWVTGATALVLTFSFPSASADADPVGAMGAPLYQSVNPATKANLVTPWASEATGAASRYNFTVNLGTPFKASTRAVSGLTPVHRLYRSKGADFTWALEGSTRLADAVKAGYQDQGINFYAAAKQLTGTEVVNSYTSGGMHRLWKGSTAADLVRQDWTLEGPAFYVPGAAAAPTPTPTTPTTTPTTPTTTPTTPTTTPTTPTTPTPTPSTTTTQPTSTPTPTTTPTTPTAPTGGPGSVPVGSASYPVPGNAVVVSPSGNDSAPGTVDSPVRTVARAVVLAPTGGTVVLRAGRYHESVTIQKTLTLQNYPGEAAWLDGSEPVSGWVQDGSVWRHDGWTTRFDSSPTYTRGASDLTAPGWQFVNPSYPMAAHPDQIFVDGQPLQQVASRSLVTAGTFFLDEGTSQLFVGTDPRGRSVDGSTLIRALSVRGPDSVVRGIGIRRFSPSVPDIAAVTLEQPRIRVENVVVEDAATTGLGVTASDVNLNRLTVRGSGMLGIHARFADRMVMTSVLSTGNNDEHFNAAPVSGGAKLGATRGVTVSNSSFSGNYGQGFWEDLSVYDTVLRNSTFSDNSATGLFLEISAKAVVVDNLVSGNRGEGIKVNNTSDVKIWNNTIVGNVGRALWLPQDTRRNTNRSDQAVDPRQPFPDPTMPWTLGPVVVRNNVVADSSGGPQCLLCVEDFGYRQSAEAMGVSSDGNVYQRANAADPQWLVVWSSGSTNPSVFSTLAQFSSRTGQDKRSREYAGTAGLDAFGALSAAVRAVEGQIALPLPADIAAIAGQTPGTAHVGRW